jgi:predicted secreted hydrolase
MRIKELIVALVIPSLTLLTPARGSEPLPGSGEPSSRGEQTDGFARALTPRPFVFPRDHGSHPDFRNEWWYLTGNLDGPDDRRFGYQWVIFRFALEPHAESPRASPGGPRPGQASIGRASAFAADQIYLGHFAVTDVKEGTFEYHEHAARGAAGLAGAWFNPLNVWLEDWSLHEDDAGVWHVTARDEDSSIELELRPLKPVVPNGDHGLSRKGTEEGNASYYYSISRLDTRGILRVADHSYPVSGTSWLDREWGTSSLSADQQGWDWFALQLQDGTDLMFYQLRRKDGSIDPHSQGTLIGRNGGATPLHPSDVELQVLDHWQSPRGGRYPSRWRMRVPSQDLTLDIQPVLTDQELDVSVRYWEGAVDITGQRSGRAIKGRGYVELVGYGSAVPKALH